MTICCISFSSLDNKGDVYNVETNAWGGVEEIYEDDSDKGQ